MIGDFAKFDNAQGRSLNEVINDAVTAVAKDVGEDTWESILDAVREVTAGAVPEELEGYHVGRVIVGEMVYYPRKRTLRILPLIRQVIFVDDLYSPDEGKPTYVTLRTDAIDGWTWYPDEDDEANTTVLKVA
jgi:N-acetylglucosamine kinase-like BadF-type ATPase